MEKRRAHYDLAAIQAQVTLLSAMAFTKAALDGGRAMGLTLAEMLDVLARLSRADFYKSMTTHADHRVWQDVYHAATPVGRVAYIKLTLINERPVVQFKER
jgi:motility quorum-sensing regulator/GCU-specific mRNA interferase toxin